MKRFFIGAPWANDSGSKSFSTVIQLSLSGLYSMCRRTVPGPFQLV
jgi:hypothetical protein